MTGKKMHLHSKVSGSLCKRSKHYAKFRSLIAPDLVALHTVRHTADLADVWANTQTLRFEQTFVHKISHIHRESLHLTDIPS